MKHFLQCALVVCCAVGAGLGQATGTASVDMDYVAGQKALAESNYAEAEKDFVKARDLEPKVAEIHASLGLVFFQEGKFDLAIVELKKALELKPSLPNLHSLLAMSLSEVGRYDEALPELQDCFSHTAPLPVRRMCGLQLERVYTGLERDADAVQTAVELQRLFPNDPEVLYHNERIYGNYAFQTVQQLVHAAPTSLWRHLAAAEANESKGDYSTALVEYREVLKQEPNRPGIHYRIGRTLLSRSRESHDAADRVEALKEFQAELTADPGNGNAAYEIGELHRQAGDLDQAGKDFEQALRDHPNFAEAHLAMAAVGMAQQKPALALPHLREATTLTPGDEVAWYRLAQAERMLGNTAEQRRAQAEYQRLHAEATVERGGSAPSEVTPQTVGPGA